MSDSSSIASVKRNEFVTPNGLACIEQPADSDTLIVALHGWMDNAASFFPLMDAMPEQHFVALEWPGHGHSAHRDDYYHFADYVDDLHLALTQLAPSKPVVLVGHSLGALVATVFAATFPELVHALVCIDGLGPLSLPLDQQVAHFRRAIEQRRQTPKVRALSSVDFAVKIRASSSKLSYENSQLLVERGILQADRVWHWRHDSRLKLSSPLRMSEQQAQVFCEAVQAPLLLLRAVQGSYLSDVVLAQRSAWFKQLDVSHVGEGHHLHMSSAKECAKKIKRMLKTFEPHQNF